MKDMFGIKCPSCNHSVHMHIPGKCCARWKNKTTPTKFHSCKCEMSSELVFLTIINKFEERVQKVEKLLDEVKSDERLGYPTATVIENAPLALIQCGLENQVSALGHVLKILKGEV